MTGQPYRLCFFVYRQLGELARRVIATLEYDDIEISLKECNFETLPRVMEQAINEGTEVFIAGSSNAAEFRRHAYGHLVEINVRLTDYLLAVKQAMKPGEKPVIAVYRYSRTVDWALLRELAAVPVDTIFYEDSTELFECIQNSDCDVVIGSALPVEVADALNKKSVLVYLGESTIENAIQRARNLAIELRSEARKVEITQAIINHAPFGLIVTDEYGEINIFNRAARQQTNIGDLQVRGQMLADVIPTLSQEEFVQSGQWQTDQNRLINGAMIRCIQTRIKYGQQMIGVLTTLHPDNTRRKKLPDTAAAFIAKGTWKTLTAHSQKMQSLLLYAKPAADFEYPLVISGECGAGKNFLAQCIHNGSPGAKNPYVTINTAALAREDAARVLFGSKDSFAVQPGLLELAQGGTVVLQHLSGASDVVQACLLQAIKERGFLRIGGSTLVPFHARVITVLADHADRSHIHEALWQQLNVLQMSVPPLRERPEDIAPMFHAFVMEESRVAPRYRSPEFLELLLFYSWPGNVVELSSVAKRYLLFLKQTVAPTPNARQHLLIQAIGEDQIFAEILRRHPALAQGSNCSTDKLLEGIDAMKYFLHYNNAKIAEKLSLSRTTLWRLKKGAAAEE